MNKCTDVSKCDIDCLVSDWSKWSTCDTTCGKGFKNRSRTIIRNQANNGSACPILQESETCWSKKECPVDCSVSDWYALSECSTQCGNGLKTKSRIIVKPNKNGGKECPHLLESEFCIGTNCSNNNVEHFTSNPLSCSCSDWTELNISNTLDISNNKLFNNILGNDIIGFKNKIRY